MPSNDKMNDKWSHPSVTLLMKKGDPVQAIIDEARLLVFKAMEAGWSGPPFDPLMMAQSLGIEVAAREDIVDARTVPLTAKKLRIEYNPTRPSGRLRFSVAHEIAHTLFEDCAERVRNRLAHNDMSGDDWQLEMLCNIGAAEIIMPVGSFGSLKDEKFSIDEIMRRRKEFEVSTEAILLRIVSLSERPCAVFAASRQDSDQRYKTDYIVSSASWGLRAPGRMQLPVDACASECTAIGFTARSDESWHQPVGRVHVECVGAPPYPGRIYPRVLGLLTPCEPGSRELPSITFVKGDATQPRGTEAAIIAQIINDKAHSWGGAFSHAIGKKWSSVHEHFQEWADSDRANLRLGNYHYFSATNRISIFSAIAQHGYGPSPKPRLRYSALIACLKSLCQLAVEKNASVHMPRLGCGEAGGRWEIVSELIHELLTNRGVAVTVYDLPNADVKRHEVKEGLF